MTGENSRSTPVYRVLVVWGCVQGFLTAKKIFFRIFFENFFDFFLAFFESSFAPKKIQIEKTFFDGD